MQLRSVVKVVVGLLQPWDEVDPDAGPGLGAPDPGLHGALAIRAQDLLGRPEDQLLGAEADVRLRGHNVALNEAL